MGDAAIFLRSVGKAIGIGICIHECAVQKQIISVPTSVELKGTVKVTIIPEPVLPASVSDIPLILYGLILKGWEGEIPSAWNVYVVPIINLVSDGTNS